MSARNIRMEVFCVGGDHRLDAEFLSDEPNPGLLNVALEFREPEMKTLIFLAQRDIASACSAPYRAAGPKNRDMAPMILNARSLLESEPARSKTEALEKIEKNLLSLFRALARATLRSIAQAMPKKNGVYSSEFSTHSFKINSPPRSTSNEKTPIEGIWFAISAHMSNSGFGTAIDNIYFP